MPRARAGERGLCRFEDHPLLSRIAATAFVEKLSGDIPDSAIRAGVKNLAIAEFARRGIAAVPGA
jgi:hypothetical protein